MGSGFVYAALTETGQDQAQRLTTGMEVAMRLIPTLIAVLLPFAAAASPLLPDTLLKTLKANPAVYLDTVAGLIASYGAPDGITEEQLGTSMALVRAKARTGAIMPLMAADLDGDGAITRDEIVAAEAAVGAGARAKIEKAFVKADLDGDAVVSVQELADFGEGAAMAAFSPAKLAGLKVLMGFDADGDGKVTMTEVKAGLAGLAS